MSKEKQGMKEELKVVIEKAYAECRAIMLKHKGTWTSHGRSANMAFRALEVSCRKLGIPTPPLKQRPESVGNYVYNEQLQSEQPQSEPREFIATSEQQPRTRKSRKNDAI